MAWFADWWSGVWAKLKAFLSSPGGIVVRDALGNVMEQAGQIGIGLLLQQAQIQAVKLEGQPGSGADKRDQALTALQKYALQTGINASASVLNWALENAVQAIKAPPPVAPVAGAVSASGPSVS